MEWKEYRRHYSDFLLSMYRSEIITFYAFENIPNVEVNQPTQEKVEIPFFANLARTSLSRVSAGYRTDHQMIESLAGIIFDSQHERYLCYQELPITLAYLEAFVGHTLAAIWRGNSNLLDQTRYVRHLIKDGKLTTTKSLSPQQFASVIEDAIRDVFRTSNEGYLRYLIDIVGLPLKVNRGKLVLAGFKRNAVIHNGGLINETYKHKLNPKERKELKELGLSVGDQIPMDYAYLCDVFNQILFFGEELFEQTSIRFFGIASPVSNRERVHKRQSLNQETNPLSPAFQKIVAQFGGSDEAVEEIKRLQREHPGLSWDQIVQLLLKGT